MGACCAAQIKKERHGGGGGGLSLSAGGGRVKEENDDDNVVVISEGDYGSLVRLQGCSNFVSMFSQQGRKGVNQDAMTVWENFIGEQDAVFCGVFDGHGPSGHKVSQYVRDVFPSRLSASFKHPQIDISNISQDLNCRSIDDPVDDSHGPLYSLVKASLMETFKLMDETLEGNNKIESYCSGTTAVMVLKKNNHLVIANLGDSRAILCTRGNKDQLLADQLTVDLKPNLPSECERIWKCNGRVMALEEEPSVFRVWMPDQDCPGLAMARAFGDFCLKDYGLISVPEVYYRKLTEKDEFVVLATDGVWDVLPNEEVIHIVSSAQKRSLAAKQVVHQAHRAWKYKYPGAKIDDCAVICLFFKGRQSSVAKSKSDTSRIRLNKSKSNLATGDGLENVIGSDSASDQTARKASTARVGKRRATRNDTVRY